VQRSRGQFELPIAYPAEERLPLVVAEQEYGAAALLGVADYDAVPSQCDLDAIALRAL
jgi:hypothetical protein